MKTIQYSTLNRNTITDVTPYQTNYNTLKSYASALLLLGICTLLYIVLASFN